jgi:nucleoside-diphosphate-sugar epimerase
MIIPPNINFETEQLRNKTILITGGTGLFGEILISFLKELETRERINLRLVTLSRSPKGFVDIEHVTHDLTKNLTIELKPDFIIHAATTIGTEHVEGRTSALRTMIEGTRNIIEFAKKKECRAVLQTSSGAVYGDPNLISNKIKEDDFYPLCHLNLSSTYSEGKRIAEILFKDASVNSETRFVSARCFAVAGKFLDMNRNYAISNFIKNALRGERIVVKSPSTTRSYLDTQSLSNWLLTILLNAKNDTFYNVGSDSPITMLELAEKIANRSGLGVQVENIGLTSNYVPCIEKAKKDFGLKIEKKIDQILNEMFDYNKEKHGF